MNSLNRDGERKTVDWVVEAKKSWKLGYQEGYEMGEKDAIEKVRKILKGLDCGFCNYEAEVTERLQAISAISNLPKDK